MPRKNKFLTATPSSIPDNVMRQLRDPRLTQSNVTAIKISGLKSLNSRSEVILLDRNGSDASASVARKLANLGFKKVYTIAGGFDAWKKANLATERSNIVFAEVYAPSKSRRGMNLKPSCSVPLADHPLGGTLFLGSSSTKPAETVVVEVVPRKSILPLPTPKEK